MAERARPFPEVPGVTHRFVQAGEVRLHVAEAGSGPPVVLLHGWPQHWYVWRHVIPLLADRHRVICPDLRGLGWSDAPDSSYAKEELAGDVLALLDALELDRVRLAGHDWGGFVGFLCCLREPARFSGFLAISIIHPWPRRTLDLRAIAAVLAYQPLVSAPVVGPLVQRFTPFYDALYATQGGARIWTREEWSAFADAFREPARARASSRLYRTFLTRELPALARGAYARRRLTVPTRMLIGRSDAVIMEEALRGGERHADDLVIEAVPGGHWLPERRPDLVAERIAALP